MNLGLNQRMSQRMNQRMNQRKKQRINQRIKQRINQRLKPTIQGLKPIIAGLVLVTLFTSCGILPKKFPESSYLNMNPKELAIAREDARSLIMNLESVNQNLKTFKGIGKLKLWNNEKGQINERAAWIVSRPVSLSIVILVSGRPAMKFAADGKYLYYIDMIDPDHSLKKIRRNDPQLDKLIYIRIKTSDIINLLSGRMPIAKHSDSIVVPDSSGYILLLENKQRKIHQKIYFNSNKTVANKVELFDDKGVLLYRAKFESMQTINKFHVPKHLVITDGNNAGFSIYISRYMANVPVPESAFVLTLPPKI